MGTSTMVSKSFLAMLSTPVLVSAAPEWLTGSREGWLTWEDWCGPYEGFGINGEGTGGRKIPYLPREAYYFRRCREECARDYKCAGFVDDTTDPRGRMCKPKKVGIKSSARTPRDGKSFYQKWPVREIATRRDTTECPKQNALYP